MVAAAAASLQTQSHQLVQTVSVFRFQDRPQDGGQQTTGNAPALGYRQ